MLASTSAIASGSAPSSSRRVSHPPAARRGRAGSAAELEPHVLRVGKWGRSSAATRGPRARSRTRSRARSPRARTPRARPRTALARALALKLARARALERRERRWRALIALSKHHGHLDEAVHQDRRQRRRLAGEREARPPREQLLEHHARFEPRERGAQAQVLAEAEGDVAPRARARDVERVGVVAEHLLVAVRRAVEERQHSPLRSRLPRSSVSSWRRARSSAPASRSAASPRWRSGAARVGDSFSHCTGCPSSDAPPEIRLRVVSLPATSSVRQNMPISASFSRSPSIWPAMRIEIRSSCGSRRRRSATRASSGSARRAWRSRRARRRRPPRSSRRTSAGSPHSRRTDAEHLGDHVHRQRDRDLLDEIDRLAGSDRRRGCAWRSRGPRLERRDPCAA